MTNPNSIYKEFVIGARPNNQPMAEWELIGDTTKSRITISGLNSGMTYDFRITCISSAGDGPVSEVFTIRVY